MDVLAWLALATLAVAVVEYAALPWLVDHLAPRVVATLFTAAHLAVFAAILAPRAPAIVGDPDRGLWLAMTLILATLAWRGALEVVRGYAEARHGRSPGPDRTPGGQPPALP